MFSKMRASRMCARSLARAYLSVGLPLAFLRSPDTLAVKFHDPVTQTSLDINVNDRLGLMNSRLLRNYGDALPGLRALLATIKLWAQPLGLNQPSMSRGSSVTFSTYSLALMTLGWLQVCAFDLGLAKSMADRPCQVERSCAEPTGWFPGSSTVHRARNILGSPFIQRQKITPSAV